MKAKDKYAATGVAARDQRFAAANRDLIARQARNDALRAEAERLKQEKLNRITAGLMRGTRHPSARDFFDPVMPAQAYKALAAKMLNEALQKSLYASLVKPTYAVKIVTTT